MDNKIMEEYDEINYSIYTHFRCSQCQQTKPLQKDGGTGYALDKSNTKLICYDCCGELDKKMMIEDKKITLYLTIDNDHYGHVSNWPGTLKLQAFYKKGKHNWGITRYDVWFIFNGYWWHGVQYGDNNQICHCKQTKEGATKWTK